MSINELKKELIKLESKLDKLESNDEPMVMVMRNFLTRMIKNAEIMIERKEAAAKEKSKREAHLKKKEKELEANKNIIPHSTYKKGLDTLEKAKKDLVRYDL